MTKTQKPHEVIQKNYRPAFSRQFRIAGHFFGTDDISDQDGNVLPDHKKKGFHLRGDAPVFFQVHHNVGQIRLSMRYFFKMKPGRHPRSAIQRSHSCTEIFSLINPSSIQVIIKPDMDLFIAIMVLKKLTNKIKEIAYEENHCIFFPVCFGRGRIGFRCR
jgi:hypothetical protein